MKVILKLQTRKKSFLIMVGMVFLMLAINMAYAGIWDELLNLFSGEKTILDVTNDDVFKELKLNDGQNTNAIFTFKNPMENINIKREDIKVNFIEICGKVNNYNLLINSTCEAERIKEYVYGTKEVCYNNTISNNKTKENITIKVCNNETFIKDTIYENYTYSCFKEFNEINAKDLRDIKIEADVKWGKCNDGWGWKIDWIPEVILNDTISQKTLIWTEMAWWNSSYSYKMPINCTNLDNFIPIVINGSTGFTISGQNQIVWTYCSGTGTALYMHNSTDWSGYAVANDTTQLPMEVEFGNGTSFNPTGVWDSGYKGVWLMKDGVNTSSISDSTNRSHTGIKYGANSPIQGTGKIGKGQIYNPATDYINVGNLNGDFNFTTGMTIEFWANVTASATTTNIFVIKAPTNYYVTTRATTYKIAPHAYIGEWKTIEGTNVITSNTWVNIVYTYDGSNMRLYVNGVEDASSPTSAPGSIAESVGDLYVGSNIADQRVNGMLDNMRVSNIARSASYTNQTYQNVLGTSGYGDLGAEEKEVPPIIYTLNGTVKDSNNAVVNNATIIIIYQLNNTIMGITNSNSIGGWNYSNVFNTTYLVVAYDPNNTTRDGDADPHIVVN